MGLCKKLVFSSTIDSGKGVDVEQHGSLFTDSSNSPASLTSLNLLVIEYGVDLFIHPDFLFPLLDFCEESMSKISHICI